MFTVHVLACEESEGSFLERVWEDALLLQETKAGPGVGRTRAKTIKNENVIQVKSVHSQ